MLGEPTKTDNAMEDKKLINFDLIRKKIEYALLNSSQLKMKYSMKPLQLPEEPERLKLDVAKLRYDAKPRIQDSTNTIIKKELAPELPEKPSRFIQDKAKTSSDLTKQTLHTPKSRHSNRPRLSYRGPRPSIRRKTI